MTFLRQFEKKRDYLVLACFIASNVTTSIAIAVIASVGIVNRIWVNHRIRWVWRRCIAGWVVLLLCTCACWNWRLWHWWIYDCDITRSCCYCLVILCYYRDVAFSRCYVFTWRRYNYRIIVDMCYIAVLNFCDITFLVNDCYVAILC